METPISSTEHTPEIPLNGNESQQQVREKRLQELIEQTGFVETPQMKECRSDPSEWAEHAQRYIENVTSKQGAARERMKLQIGYNLTVASLFYKDKGSKEYKEALNDALTAAQFGRFEDWENKIQNLLDPLGNLE